MTLLVFGLVLFLGIHSVSIVANGSREAAVARFGEGPWKGLYSVVAAVGLALIVYGYPEARLEGTLLYQPPPWTRHLTATLMLPVFPLLLAAYLPGRIRTAAKHPMLVSVKLWAVAHLVSNGFTHDVLLFAGFLTWAVLDRISLARRPARPITTAPTTPVNDLLAVVLGLALYAGTLMWAHRAWIGVAPLG